jgi:hypothetical protein
MNRFIPAMSFSTNEVRRISLLKLIGYLVLNLEIVLLAK